MARISSKLVNYLDKNKYKYEMIEHKTTYTAWDTAQTKKIKPREVGKALAMLIDGEAIIALLSSDRKLDKKKLLKLINNHRKKKSLKLCKKIDFAKESWMKKNLPGKLGAIAPFEGVIKKKIFMDRLLAKNKKIYLGSGEYNVSLRVSSNQYLKVEKPIIGNFSAKK